MIFYLNYDSFSPSFDPRAGFQVGCLCAIPVSGLTDGRPSDPIPTNCFPWWNLIALLLAVAATVGGLGFLDRPKCG
jgi:hypothetical protein